MAKPAERVLKPRSNHNYDTLTSKYVERYKKAATRVDCFLAGVASADDLGGWSESKGSFSVVGAASAVGDGVIRAAAAVKHTGKKEEKVINGTSSKRAVGHTEWAGVYHYTRARVEGGQTPTDSGRKWGTSKTSATSPWQKFSATHGFGTAKTYYGH